MVSHHGHSFTNQRLGVPLAERDKGHASKMQGFPFGGHFTLLVWSKCLPSTWFRSSENSVAPQY